MQSYPFSCQEKMITDFTVLHIRVWEQLPSESPIPILAVYIQRVGVPTVQLISRVSYWILRCIGAIFKHTLLSVGSLGAYLTSWSKTLILDLPLRSCLYIVPCIANCDSNHSVSIFSILAWGTVQ